MNVGNRLTVLGCGNGGMALAADLKLKGAEVALWSDPNHASKFTKIVNSQGRIAFHDGDSSHTVKLDVISENLEEVIEFSDVLYNCTPMVAHTAIFKQLTHYLSENKPKLLINLSGVFSSIEQLLNISDSAIYHALKVFDTSTFPYACRARNNNNVSILGRKSDLAIAPLFSADMQYLNCIPDHLKPSKFNQVENTFKIGLMGTNAILHPATVLFNARLIDEGHTFQFYQEGISKRTSLLHESLDSERLLLAKAMGYELSTCAEDYSKFYNGDFKNIYDFNINSPSHSKVQAPTSLNHRFVTEDIAYALTPLLSLSKLYNIKLPVIESLVTIFSTIMETDFYECGRNLQGISVKLIDTLSQPNCNLEHIVA